MTIRNFPNIIINWNIICIRHYWWKFDIGLDICSAPLLSKLHLFQLIQWVTLYVVHDMASWWRHQMETFSALLAMCAGNSPGTGEFPTQRPVTRSFDVYFDLRPNKRLSKQSWGWWFETLLCSLWRHRNVITGHEHDISLTFKCQ